MLFVTDNEGEVYRQGADRQVRDRHVVFFSVSGGVWQADKVVDMRVLSKVYEAGKIVPISPGLCRV